MTKEERREYNRKYYQSNKEKKAEYNAEYRKTNKDKIAEYKAEYRKANKEKIAEYKAEYYQANKEEVDVKKAEYRATPMGRAVYLISNYRQSDNKYNRGECTLTPQWIVDNIFSKPCHYCGESDWHKIGCDRIYNSKPHTEDNVVTCCEECNKKRGTMEYNEFVNKMKYERKETNQCLGI